MHRNRRTVWTLQTKPYKGPHHATMPPGLARDPILASTSPRCCAVCGAPWTRQIEVEYINPGNRKTNGPRSLERRGETAGFKTRLERRTKTTGWEPSCDHADGSGRAVVFDPFLGSGTTAMVAAEHDRLWLGFDNNPECAQLIERRTKLVQRSLGLENL